jgi:hypothetical protein
MMSSEWIQQLKCRWRELTGAFVLLLMFFVPVARAVVASSPAQGSQKDQTKTSGQLYTILREPSAPKTISPIIP